MLAAAEKHVGGPIVLMEGSATDESPEVAIAAAGVASGSSVAYPPYDGTLDFLETAASYLQRRFGADVSPYEVVSNAGSYELITILPLLLKDRWARRDTVLVPSLGFGGYAIGARLAGLRVVPVPLDDRGAMDLTRIESSDIERSVLLWVNSPHNPTGSLSDLGAIADWGRAHEVIVASDEVYSELTWDGRPRSILEHGAHGVLAVHSLSKRSSMRGFRVGFSAGDEEIVGHIADMRERLGWMVSWQSQAAAAAALADDAHVELLRDRYVCRLHGVRETLRMAYGIDVPMPQATHYLWVPAPDGMTDRDFALRLAADCGVIVAPGSALFGDAPQAATHVRFGMGASIERIDLMASRLSGGRT
jgi:aspartate/methionine/tyrosine aminotransferase